MTPRKRASSLFRYRVNVSASRLVTKMELGAYIAICVALYALFRAWLPGYYADALFWVLILKEISLDRSWEWAAALIRAQKMWKPGKFLN
jgi:hypothetical protein